MINSNTRWVRPLMTDAIMAEAGAAVVGRFGATVEVVLSTVGAAVEGTTKQVVVARSTLLIVSDTSRRDDSKILVGISRTILLGLGVKGQGVLL